ncbi:MAG TPA: M28 family peptidase [Armatimonadota bacterium]|nr:M28 family peptidase [Armatimonadota bacterium]
MIRKLVLFIAVLNLVFGCIPVALAIDIQDVVNQVSQATYTDYLNNELYTRLGNDRGWGKHHNFVRTNILNLFTSYGLQTTTEYFTFEHESGPVTGANLIAVHQGTTRPNDIYLVGAHYDSAGNPGADDNASGVAGVLEAARVLSQFSFEATLVFVAFDWEELGLIGSRAYVDRHIGDNIQGMISLDMIAYNPTGAYHNQALIHGYASSDPWKQSLAASINTYGNGITPTIAGTLNASDHAPFEWAGYQACLLIEAAVWSNPHYHRQTDSVDTPNYIDYIYATNMTRSTVGCLANSAGLIGPVPEPSGLLVASGGLIWFAAVVRRRVRV